MSCMQYGMDLNTSSKVSRMDLGLPGRFMIRVLPRMPAAAAAMFARHFRSWCQRMALDVGVAAHVAGCWSVLDAVPWPMLCMQLVHTTVRSSGMSCS